MTSDHARSSLLLPARDAGLGGARAHVCSADRENGKGPVAPRVLCSERSIALLATATSGICSSVTKQSWPSSLQAMMTDWESNGPAAAYSVANSVCNVRY